MKRGESESGLRGGHWRVTAKREGIEVKRMMHKQHVLFMLKNNSCGPKAVKRTSTQHTASPSHKRAIVNFVFIITATTTTPVMGADRGMEVARRKESPWIDLRRKPMEREKNLRPTDGSPAPHKSKKQSSRNGKKKDDDR